MNITKKLITVTLLCAASLVASAQSGVSLPFIGQGNNTDGGLVPQGISGYLQITPTSTNSYAATNTWVKSGLVINGSGNYYTNVANTCMTNYYTDPMTGTVYTNGQVAPLYVTNANAIADVDLWANRDGTVPNANLSVDINGYAAFFTNTVTFYFATVNGGGLAVNTGFGLFNFSVTGNGTNDVIVQTNLSTTIPQGARKLRLLKVGSTNAGTNGQVVNLWLNGYKPAGQ